MEMISSNLSATSAASIVLRGSASGYLEAKQMNVSKYLNPFLVKILKDLLQAIVGTGICTRGSRWFLLSYSTGTYGTEYNTASQSCKSLAK